MTLSKAKRIWEANKHKRNSHTYGYSEPMMWAAGILATGNKKLYKQACQFAREEKNEGIQSGYWLEVAKHILYV